MELSQLSISDYDSFVRYITNVRRTSGYPYDRFVVMVLQLPRRVAISYLREATCVPDEYVKCEALDLLSRLSPLDATPRCFELLHAEDPDVRIAALTSLQFMEVPCEEYIGHLLKTETDGNVRCTAVRLLSVIGTTRSIPTLSEIALHDASVNYESRPIRWFAEKALEAIGARAR